MAQFIYLGQARGAFLKTPENVSRLRPTFYIQLLPIDCVDFSQKQRTFDSFFASQTVCWTHHRGSHYWSLTLFYWVQSLPFIPVVIKERIFL